MNEHVILFCNLEHLPPHDVAGTPGKWAFGLNLAVGINDELPGVGLNQLKPFMQPWTWPQIIQVKVRVRDGANGRTTTESIPAVKWKGETIDCVHCRDEQAGLRTHIDAEFELSKAVGIEAFKWQPNGALGKTSLIRTRPWHTFVGQLSTNPPPFPQCLNLSFIFFVDKINTAGPKSVFAAPVLLSASASCPELVLPFGAKLLPRGDEPREWTGHPGIFQWGYETEAGADSSPLLIAHQAECRVRQAGAPPAAFLDLDTQWVGKLPANELDHFEEDWRSMLEERMADSLDIGQRIIEYLRNEIDNAAVVGQLKVFQWMVIASLRDMAGVGIHRGPDGARFIDLALRTLKSSPGLTPAQVRAIEEGITEAQKDAIEAKAKEKFGRLDKWIKFVADRLPELSKLSVLALPRVLPPSTAGGSPSLQTVVPEEQTTVKSIIAELEQLHQAVLDPKNLAMLVRDQWREVCGDVLPPDVLVLLDKTKLDSLNTRHALALENLGDLWRVFVLMPAPGDSGHDLIRQNFSCLFQEYFCKRFNLSLADLTVDVGGVRRTCDITAIQSAGEYRVRQPEIVSEFQPAGGAVELLRFPISGDIRQALLGRIKDWSKTFIDELLPKPGTIEPTDVPHAVTLQVDGLAGRPAETPNPDQQDILNRISGVAVLMREAGADNDTNWRCLNFAAAFDRPATTTIADPVLVPSRLNYRNGLRQSFISYNNHPVTAESPLASAAMTPVRLRHPDEARWDDAERRRQNSPPIINYKVSQDAIARRLPALRFGKTFEVLPFVVANCGALPAALLSRDPARTSPIEASLNEFNVLRLSANERSKIRRVEYLRKVRVGGLRVFNELGKVSLKMPLIPENVFPRARDIHKAAMDNANTVATMDPAKHPLLLLAPREWEDQNTGAASSFAFSIRKPATDLNTWDRWIAGTLPAARRASVWADFYRRSEEKRQAERVTTAQGIQRFEQVDTSIDDPAVIDKFFFELWLIDGAQATLVGSDWATIDPQPGVSEKLPSVQFMRMRVRCALDPTEGLNTTGFFTFPSGERVRNVEVKVKQGAVYQLNIFSVIAKADYEGNARRFADVINGKREITVPGSGSAFLVSPFSMLIEVATNELIEDLAGGNDEQLLWQRLNPVFSPPSHLGAIAFNLQRTAVAGSEGFKYLQRAELLRQVWRWQGRETPLHPRLKASNPCNQDLDQCDEMDKWEAWEFGNRFETDHLVQDMTAQPPTRLGGRQFFYKEVLEEGNSDNDELRALHYRFAVRVFSRYAGIMPAGVPSSLLSRNRTLPQKTAGENKGTIWRRLFVPCRRTKELPIPKVKLILPLTESFGDEVGNTAGLLLVLNEPWYQEAGLGEGIAAEVQMTPDPENNPTAPTAADSFYFELGTDPIMASAERGYSQSQDPSEVFDEVCLNQKIRGPVGHSFDRTNESPLFTATSFIIPAPAIFSTKNGRKVKQAPDFSWDFCRLRFRRVVALSKDVAPAAANQCNLMTASVENCDRPNSATQLQGPFTDPYWVQYLPEFSHFAPADTNLGDARLKLEQKGGPVRLSIVDRAGQRISLSPGPLPTPTPAPSPGPAPPAPNNIFELYLVLTRRVFDVTGRPDQEVYLEVFHTAANNLWETGTAFSLPNDNGLRARIIEVQRRQPRAPAQPLPPFVAGEQLWAAMFGPTSNNQDTMPDRDLARIVRISQPIESLSAASVDC